jgi:hypothetical protein
LSRRPEQRIADVILCCEKILRFTSGMGKDQLAADERTTDAVLRNVERSKLLNWKGGSCRGGRMPLASKPWRAAAPVLAERCSDPPPDGRDDRKEQSHVRDHDD